MRAKVQGRFLFAGKVRKPGDVLTQEELDKASPTVRDALVAQKMIVLDPDTQGERTNLDGLLARLSALEERVAALEDKRQRAQRVVG